MKIVLLFGGTGDSRRLIECLSAWPVELVVSVATDYGAERFDDIPGVRIVAGRMDAAAITACLGAKGCDAVVDATHPYAVEATAQIRAACEATGVAYYRLRREGTGANSDGVVWFGDMAAAVAYMRDRPGNILATTGSKDLAAYTALPGYRERVYLRVLPMVASLEACGALGFRSDHILAMQGPFSRELNLALMRQLDIRYLVTKDGGATGGLPEKLEAAREAGVEVLIIARPDAHEGMSMDALIVQLKQDLGVQP